MKKAMNILLLLLLLGTVLCGQKIMENLPAPRDGAIQEMHEGWAGVLRLWICDEWESLSPWLNKRIAAFERQHSGVYIQATTVTAEIMAKGLAGEFSAPDMIIFPPGLATDTTRLTNIEGIDDTALIPALRLCGTAKGKTYAIPIAMGGYAWVCSADAIDTLPHSWADTEFAMRAQEDSAWQTTSAALIALCAGSEFQSLPEQAGSGMDLGLPNLQPTPAPLLAKERITSRLSPDFAHAGDAYSLFIKEEADAMPVTQREIHRLQTRTESGKGPDWTIYAAGEAFTDQLAMFAIVNQPKEDTAARAALGQELLLHLLKEESQAALSAGRALRATDGEALYSAQTGMAQLEAAYRGKPLFIPNAFDAAWRQEAQTIFSLFAGRRISPEAAWSKLAEILAEGYR